MDHFHIAIESQDCDGRYDRSYVASYADRTEAVMAFTPSAPPYEHYRTEHFDVIRVTTDEGYVRTELAGCDDPDCWEVAPSYRDHSAEAMGY